jgi:hypothetical protein
MDAADAAEALKRSVGGRELTIADASVRSGLALRDAERGLHHLLSEYRGHLRVTADGDLLFIFPYGFEKPWVTRTRLRAAAEKAGRALVGAGRFIVRAWIAIVLVGYVLLFVAILIGLMFARSSGSDSRESRGGGLGFGLAHVLFRVIADALFWTFHPFSPFAYIPAPAEGYGSTYARGRPAVEAGPKTPFYEKVNRFFFGPETPPPDPTAASRAILAEIRAQKGRIGLADVMRVTGLPREEADPMMSRLMLDYDGSVEVSEEGGISYRFTELRKTMNAREERRPAPVWSKTESLPPLTGNSFGANALIVGLNAFNLAVSSWALARDLTFSKVAWLMRGVPWEKIPSSGTAIALGVVPLVFSIALFLVPVGRAIARPLRARRIARENGRRAVLRAVLEGVEAPARSREAAEVGGVDGEALEAAYREAAGREPAPGELTREVVSLGGDAEITSQGRVRYRFRDLEAEATALEAEREAAAEEETRPAPVVFTSEA